MAGWVGGWSDNDYKAISVPIGIELEVIGTELGNRFREIEKYLDIVLKDTCRLK